MPSRLKLLLNEFRKFLGKNFIDLYDLHFSLMVHLFGDKQGFGLGEFDVCTSYYIFMLLSLAFYGILMCDFAFSMWFYAWLEFLCVFDYFRPFYSTFILEADHF